MTLNELELQVGHFAERVQHYRSEIGFTETRLLNEKKLLADAEFSLDIARGQLRVAYLKGDHDAGI